MNYDAEKFKVCRFMKRDVCMNEDELDYYGAEISVGVPFMWESQPGTPKHKNYSQSPLPPLSPPPSYFTTTTTIKHASLSKNSNLNLFASVFSKRKTPSSPITSFSSSSSRSSSSPRNFRKGVVFSTPRMSFDSRACEERHESKSPVSALCFGRRSGHAKSCGCLVI